jgi:hypothetical protein
MPTPVMAPPAAPKTVSPWVWGFRYLRWSVYLAAFVTLILLLHKPTPPHVNVSPQAAERAQEKVEQVEESASRGEPATLRLDESELNSYLASRLKLNSSAAAAPVSQPAAGSSAAASTTTASTDTVTNASTQDSDSSATGASASPSESDTVSDADIEQARSSVRDVKVQMEGDQVRAYVIFDVHGKDMSLELVGHLGSSDGYLKFEPISGQLGSLPIPQSTLEGAVQHLMDSPENREKLRLPGDIREMHIENGELVATYN